MTGAGKGIGQAIAQRLAEAGARVLVADIDEAAAKETASTITSLGGRAAYYKIDVSQEAEVEAMLDVCEETLGPVTILVNNAGIYPPEPIADMSEEDFERVLHVNLRSVFLTTKHASEVMKQQGGGRIINITSIDALHPSMIGLAHYDASKHGLWGFTKNSALELAKHKIWVNAIAPGGVATPGVAAMNPGGAAQSDEAVKAFMARIPMGRMGDSDEIGKVVLFLASDMSSYMTGSQIVVDGGALLA